MNRPRLTNKQQQTYDFIRDFIARFGHGPTYREICDYFGYKAIGTAQELLRYLERADLIRRIPNVTRGIVLTGPTREEEAAAALLSVVRVPLLGYVAAGRPIERLIADEVVAVPQSMTPGGGHYFALRVKGDSMRDENIADGDKLICLSTSVARDGDKVIALVDETEATVKKFYRAGEGAIRLEPANSRYKAMVIAPAERVRVQGLVSGLLRQYAVSG